MNYSSHTLIRRGRLGAAALVLGAAAITPAALATSDAHAANKRWALSVDTTLSASQLGLPAGTSASTLAKRGVARSLRQLGLSRSRLGKLGVAYVETRDPEAPIVRLRQTAGGLRVVWSQFSVNVARGEVQGISGTAVPVRGKLTGKVKVSRSRARRVASKRIRGRDSAKVAGLVAYAGEPDRPKAPRRAWLVEVSPDRGAAGDDVATGVCVVVSATTGKVLKVWRGSAAVRRPARASASGPRARASAGTVLAQYVDAKGSASTKVPNRLYDLVTNGNPFRYDTDGAFLPSTGGPTPLNAGNPPFRTAIDISTNVARYMCVVRKWCGRYGGSNGFYNRHFFTINWGGSPAKYRHSQERVYIPAAAARDHQVIAHELGHSADLNQSADLQDTTETDEVTEAIADMFSFDAWRNTPAPPGVSSSISARLASPSLFTLGGVNLPSKFASYRCSASDVHFNGFILGHAYFRLKEKTGFTNAGRMLYGIPALLPARRTFGSVRSAFLGRARSMFGAVSPQRTAVIEAFNEVGVSNGTSRDSKC